MATYSWSKRDIIRKKIRWKIGDGRSISFWLDNWLSHASLIELLNTSSDQVNINLKVFDLILQSNGSFKKCNIWYQFNSYKIIKGIPLPSIATPEIPIWGCSSSRKFSVKSDTWLAITLILIRKIGSLDGFGI